MFKSNDIKGFNLKLIKFIKKKNEKPIKPIKNVCAFCFIDLRSDRKFVIHKC